MAARVVGLLLAAGRGRRFARASAARHLAAPPRTGTAPDKLLCPIGGIALARRSCEALTAGCEAVFAVLRPDAPAALAETLHAAGARLIVADRAWLGMGHSLAAGAQAIIDAGGTPSVLVLPADMPWVRPDTVGRVAAALRAPAATPADSVEGRIVVPRLPDGRSGHPVGFGPGHLAALSRLEGDRGARALRDGVTPTFVEVDDAGILRDVDLPSDLPPS